MTVRGSAQMISAWQRSCRRSESTSVLRFGVGASAPAGRSVAIRQLWDLLPLKLQAGDRVVTKLIATDHKGNVGESAAISATIVSAGFSRARLASLEAQQLVAEELGRLITDIDGQRDLCAKTINEADSATVPKSQQALDAYNVAQGHEQLPREVNRVLGVVIASMSKVLSGAEAHGLLAVGQQLTNARLLLQERPLELFDQAISAQTAAQRVRFRNDLVNHYRATSLLVSRILQGTNSFIADESLEIAEDMLHDLTRPGATGDSRQSSSASSNSGNARLLRQASITIQQCEAVSRLIMDAQARSRQRELPQIAKALSEKCAAIEAILSDPKKAATLPKNVAELDALLPKTLVALRPVVDAPGGWRDWGARGSDSWGRADSRLCPGPGQTMERCTGTTPESGGTGARPRNPAEFEDAKRFALKAHLQLLNHDGPQVLGRISDRINLESACRDADWRDIADLGLAYRALGDLLDRVWGSGGCYHA